MATDDVVNKLEKLTEMTRRDFLRGTSATVAPKIPGQGLQSLIKGIPLSLEELYRIEAQLTTRLVEYFGSILGDSALRPGGFEGLEHTIKRLDNREAEEIGRKYHNNLRDQRDEVRKKIDKAVPSRPGSPEGMRFDTKPLKGLVPLHQIEDEVRDRLLEQEKITGRTLVTRSAGPHRTIPIGSPLSAVIAPTPKPKNKLEGPERTTRPDEPKRTTKPKEPERKPQPQKPSTSPRITRTASPPPQLPSGKDLSRIALRGAATLAGWPLYAASFGIPSARSGESQVLAELADQPGADVDAALRNYRQRLAQEQQELDLRGELVMSGMP